MPAKFELIVNDNRELIEAGRRGELGRLRALLVSGTDADARDEYGSTPLHAAASWSDRAMASLLIDHGADVHARDGDGGTPIHIAAAFGDRAIIGLLLDRGAGVNARDDAGWTPLHLAARLGRVEEAAYLLGRGADADARTTDGQTPLAVALSNSFLRDRREPLERLFGEGTRRDGAELSLPSPGEIADDPDALPTPEEWRKLKVELTHDYGLRRMEDREVRYDDEPDRAAAGPIRQRTPEDKPLPSPGEIAEDRGEPTMPGPDRGKGRGR